MQPDIFQYHDYRAYLRDYYNEQKATRRYFSYRYFARKAGVNAPTLLYYIINGKRNMSLNTIGKFSRAIGHGKEEAAYFENLVLFNQAGSVAEKTRYYRQLVDVRVPVAIQTISPDRYEYYATWYHSIVREAVTILDFQDDFKRLAAFIVPPITASQAKRSVALLEKLGFIERHNDGRYYQTSALIGVKTDRPEAIVVEHLQMEMQKAALASFDRFPRSERLAASTTFSISRETFELFKTRTREFRKELMEIARLDENPERVYEFTFNLFPMSRDSDEQTD